MDLRRLERASKKADPAAPQVCLKIFSKVGRSNDFQKEAARMRALDAHPLIIALLGDYVRPNGDGVLVLPYYAAGSLSGWFEDLSAKQGALSAADWAQARRVLRQLLQALSYLHARRIVHRDIKPANLLWSDREACSIVVADFGIARDLNRPLDSTKHLGGAGTLGYAAPEVVAGAHTSKEAPWAADMWAFGVMALQLATGHMWQWNGTRERLERPPDVPFSELPGAGAEARELVVLALSCLHLQPSARPSADEALQAAFFASPAELPSAASEPALAAKLSALCDSLRALRAGRAPGDSPWPLPPLPAEGEPLCRALLSAVAAAAPAELLRSWAVQLGAEAAPLSSALRAFWVALPATGLLEQSAPERPFLPRAGADRGQLTALGRLLGKCLLEGSALELELAPTLFAALLGGAHAALFAPGSALAHLAAFDAEAACEHRSTLCARLGSGGGAGCPTAGAYLGSDDATPLSDANKAQLVCASIRRQLLESRAAELGALKAGFCSVAAAAGVEPALAQLSEWELGAQLSGASGFADRAQLLRGVAWAAEWPAEEPQRAWLEQLLASLSAPALRLLTVRCAGRVRLSSGAGAALSVARGAAGEQEARLLGGGALLLPPHCPSYAAFAARLLRALGLGEGAAGMLPCEPVADPTPPPPPADCAVCLSAPPDTALLPCGHLCMCGACAARMMASTRRCPLCRLAAQSASRIFQ
jgi:hypothetical protein